MPYQDIKIKRRKARDKDDLVQWMLREIKTRNRCTDCGLFHYWYQMEFDHPNGIKPKHFPASKSGGRTRSRPTRRPVVSHTTSWSGVFRELREVDVVCANCHRSRSFMRGEWGEARDLG